LPAIAKDFRVSFWVGTDNLALQPATYNDHSDELGLFVLHA